MMVTPRAADPGHGVWPTPDSFGFARTTNTSRVDHV
jgi:hypothetical protein